MRLLGNLNVYLGINVRELSCTNSIAMAVHATAPQRPRKFNILALSWWLHRTYR